MRLDVDLTRLRRAPLVYVGDQERTFAYFKGLAESAGAEFHAVPARGHSGAFQDVEAVAPIVRDFLVRDPATTAQ